MVVGHYLLDLRVHYQVHYYQIHITQEEQLIVMGEVLLLLLLFCPLLTDALLSGHLVPIHLFHFFNLSTRPFRHVIRGLLTSLIKTTSPTLTLQQLLNFRFLCNCRSCSFAKYS